MYNKDKVAPLNLPLPFIWALSPFFPTGAPHTPLPRGGNTPIAREGYVCSISPCASMPSLFPVTRLPRAQKFAGSGLLPLGRAVFVLQEPVFSNVGHLPDAGGADIEAPGLGFEPKWLPSLGDWPLPSLLLPFNSCTTLLTRTGWGRAEAARGGWHSPGVLSGEMTDSKTETAACHVCSFPISSVPLCPETSWLWDPR